VAVSERRQNLARLREIARVAARHGFGYAFERRPILRGGDEAVTEAGEEGSPSTRGPRLRAMLDELGPTFVKFGQLLSTRPDIVPPDIVAELRGLQDDVSPVPFDQVRRVVEEELGLTIEQAFVEFDERPLAAASIGQVHLARLPGGQEVVVKVQRPDAERQISADLQLMYQAARVAKERVKRLAFIDVVGLVDEFARSVRQELDYRIEARNAEVFRRSFAGDDTVRVPRVYWRQTTQRVLTLERVEGVVLAHLDLADMALDDRRLLANRVAETWMKMVFLHGVFHGDPHPANIIVVDPNTVGLVDFGQVGQLTTRDRTAAVRLFLDIVNQDFDRVPRRLRELGVRYPRELEEEFREQLTVLLQRYYGAALSEIDARDLIGEIFATIYRLQIELPARWVMLDKTIATLAGVGLEIFPDFNVFETARPYAQRMVTDRYRPDRLAARGRADLQRYTEAILEYPFQISDLLNEFRDGEVKITILLENFQDLIAKAQASVNRVALAVLAAAIFLGSAIIGAGVEDGPQLLGVNVLALPGIAVGIALAVLLLMGLFRAR
jgi:ubiquinone biosynthesis protein